MRRKCPFADILIATVRLLRNRNYSLRERTDGRTDGQAGGRREIGVITRARWRDVRLKN